MAETTTSVANWQFNQYHVQSELTAGDFIAAESTLLAAGPPSLGMTGITKNRIGQENQSEFDDPGEAVYPIGVVDGFSVSQARQNQKLFEIGSSRSYFVPGKTMGTAAISRALYNGPSLLRVLYAYYRQNRGGEYPKFNWARGDDAIDPATGLPNGEQNLLYGDYQEQLLAIRANPGFGNFFINIASELFNQPTGLMVYMRNSRNVDFGAIYLEQVYVGGHQFQLNASVNVIMESVTLEFERLVPVEVSLRPMDVAVLANTP